MNMYIYFKINSDCSFKNLDIFKTPAPHKLELALLKKRATPVSTPLPYITLHNLSK